MKSTVIAWLIAIGCLLSAGESFRLYFRELKANTRLLNAVAESKKELTYYKSKAGQDVAKSNVLQIQLKELRAAFPEVITEIQNLKVKPGRAQLYSETEIITEKHITTVLKDSIVFDTIKGACFNFTDKWYNVSGCKINDSLTIAINSQDSIVQVLYKGDRVRHWLWILSRRKLQQSITSKNPANKIIYSRVVEIEK